jgi:hypothetical protein
MTDRRGIERAVGAYLEKVAAEMANIPSDERENILRDIEAHVYESLEKRAGPSATLDDLSAVLSEMAPPGSYAQPSAVAPPAPVAVIEPRLCKMPIVAAVLFALSLLFWILLLAAGAGPQYRMEAAFGSAGFPHPFFAQRMLVLFAVPALALSAAATVLGFAGMFGIRTSGGRLYGMPLAVAMALVYPLVILDLFAARSAVELGVVFGFKTGLITVTAALIIDVLIYVMVVKWASPKPFAPAAAAALREARPRLSWLAVIGGLLIPLGFLILGMLAAQFVAMYSPAREKAGLEQVFALAFTFLCIGLVVPAIATGFGLAGISKIRASRGQLTGMLVAVAASLFYPLCTLSAILFYVVAAVAQGLLDESGMNPAIVVILAGIGILLVLALDIAIFRWVWRWATRPLKEAELT